MYFRCVSVGKDGTSQTPAIPIKQYFSPQKIFLMYLGNYLSTEQGGFLCVVNSKLKEISSEIKGYGIKNNAHLFLTSSLRSLSNPSPETTTFNGFLCIFSQMTMLYLAIEHCTLEIIPY